MTQLQQVEMERLRTQARRDMRRYAGKPGPPCAQHLTQLAELEYRLGQHLAEQA